MNASAHPSLNLGVIGLGRIFVWQGAALCRTPALRLVAGADTLAAAAERLPPDVAFYARAEDLLADARVEAVLISTPPASHVELAASALAAGKSVLLEKPAAPDRASFDRLMAATANARARLVVAFHAAFAADVRWFLARWPALREDLGDVRELQAAFSDPYLYDAERAATLGGSWLDSGVNALSVLAALTDLRAARVAASHMDHGGGHRGRAGAEVRLCIPHGEGGGEIRATITTRWTDAQDHKSTRLRFTASADELVLDHTAQQVVRITPAGNAHLLFQAQGDRLTHHYAGVFEDFAAHIRHNTDNLPLARAVHRLLFEAADHADS